MVVLKGYGQSQWSCIFIQQIFVMILVSKMSICKRVAGAWIDSVCSYIWQIQQGIKVFLPRPALIGKL